MLSGIATSNPKVAEVTQKSHVTMCYVCATGGHRFTNACPLLAHFRSVCAHQSPQTFEGLSRMWHNIVNTALRLVGIRMATGSECSFSTVMGTFLPSAALALILTWCEVRASPALTPGGAAVFRRTGYVFLLLFVTPLHLKLMRNV